ncbi:uncharacterized protein [Coffea arabica]|uniref:Uncharacterized protein n=2 Tax=Coffea TaxID=13442 RepID=A0A6P6W4Y1_COFAR|nr:uncharacterized protein LOC113729509 [Coffea arabica]
MGSKKIWHLIWVMCYMLLLPYVQGQSSLNRDSLDSFVHDYALKAMRRMRTGILYNISLPANYSGIQVSVVRLRTARLWLRGANFSFFDIPPRTLPHPFSRRLLIVYQNLGNLSGFYYSVPNHTFVTPVIGLLAYDTNTSRMVKFNITRDPILVHFPLVSGVGDTNITAMKCVRFGTNGEVEFSNLTMANKCIAMGQGHFSIVIPSQPLQPPVPSPSNKSKERDWKWWVIGFGVGIGGLILLVMSVILLYKLIRKKRIAKMERQSEKSEVLGTIWVGPSRMPSATGIRTQPVIENSYVP